MILWVYLKDNDRIIKLIAEDNFTNGKIRELHIY